MLLCVAVLAFVVAFACAPASAYAAFGLTKLRADTVAGPENYVYTAGDAIAAQGTVDSNRYYRFAVLDPAGVTRWMSLCQYGGSGGAVSGTYTVGAGDETTTDTGWQLTLLQYKDDPLCVGTVDKQASRYYTVARVTAFADQALTTPQSTFDTGSRVYVTIAGLGKISTTPDVVSENDWEVSWISPSGAAVCANTGGADRPDSSATGAMPPPAGSSLWYRPNTAGGGDAWNRESNYEDRPCVDLTSADLGDWRVRFEADGTHFVELPAFSLGIPAAPTVTSGPSNPSSDETPSWSFTGEGVTYECRLEADDASVISDWATCSSPATFNLAAQPDRGYTFLVRALNGSGTAGPATTSGYVLDRTPPAAPTVTSQLGATGSSTASQWTIAAGAGTTLECRVTSGATVLSGWASCTSPFAYGLGAEPDGLYTVTARATDAAGNTGPEGSDDYLLDRAAPGAPTLDSVPPDPVVTESAQWSFSGPEPGVGYDCRLEESGGTTVRNWATCTDPHTYDLTGVPQGDYVFLVRSVDAAGNVGGQASDPFTLDRSGPPAPTIGSGPADVTSDETPQWSFSGTGVSFECRLTSGPTVVSDWAACTDPAGFDLSSEGDGDYTFSVRGVDGGGNRGQAATDDFTLDRAAPAAPTITTTPGSLGADDTPEWDFTDEPGATFECRLERDGITVSDWASCTGPRQYDVSGGPDGTFTFLVHARDAAGNVSADATDVYELDRTAPAMPAITSEPPAVSADESPSWGFSGEPDAGFECRLQRPGFVVSDWAACSTPEIFDLSAEPDDDYTFSVRAVDASGNTGPAAADTFTLDRSVPPAPTITSDPGAAGNSRSPEWAFSAAGATSYNCRVVRGATVVSDWASCTSPYSEDLSLQPDATYTFSVTAVNAAGTEGPAATHDYTLDATAPAAPSLTGGPAATSADDTPQWTYTAEAGATTDCRIERGATVVSDWAACTSPAGYDLSGEADGTYTFRVRATDAAGNTGPDVSDSYDLDRAQPPAPTIDSSPPASGSDRSPQWAFSGSSGTYECRVNGGAWASCTSPHTVSLTGQPDAAYTFDVRAISGTGVAGPAATDTYTLDTSAPGAPVITAGPAAAGSATKPAWTFTTEPGSSASCRLEREGAVVSDWASCSSPRDYDVAGQADGTFTFLVRAIDGTGNTGPSATATYALDRVPPAAPEFESGPGPLGANRAPVFAFKGEAGAALECRVERDAGTVLSDWALCSSPRSVDLLFSADGSHTFAVRAVDTAGNRSAEARTVYVLDTTPGALSIVSGPPSLGRSRAPSWAFTGEPLARFECRLERDGVEVFAWAACGSPRGYDLLGAPDGSYRFVARAFDPVGNASPEAAASYELDTTPPAAPAIEGAPQSPGHDRSPTWRFSGEPAASFECRIDRGGVASHDWGPCATPFTADMEKVDEGTHRFRVRATDRAGNTGKAAEREYELRDPAPEAKPDPKPDPEREQEPEKREEAPVVPPPADPKPPVEHKEESAPAPKTDDATGKEPRKHVTAPAPGRTPAAAGDAAAKPEPREKPEPAAKKLARDIGNVGKAVGKAVASAVVDHPDKSVFPASLIFIVLGFLAVQGRLDRSDPKLALAPVHADPDLEFPPPSKP